MPHLRSLAALTVLAAAVVACGGGSNSGVDLTGKPFQSRRGERAVTVDAVDNNFRPQYLTVSIGTVVTFDNVGRNIHNVISIGDGFASINVDDFAPDDSGTVTFDAAGDYPYYCTLHGTPTRGMNGAIRVVK